MHLAGLLIAALTAAPGAELPDRELAQRYAPVLVHDARERFPLASAGDARVAVPGAPPPAPPTAYARVRGRILQYWLFYPDNPHDRGIVRTGRHEGDWELVQVRLGRDGRPVRALASVHSGAEACAWTDVRRRGTHPVVFVAHGSHAGAFRPGVRDRTWPDPNDEARGDGEVVRPRIELVGAREPAWMRWPGRWGRSRAGWIPGESDSPRGPAFQGLRWEDPRAFEARAAPCGPEPNRAETALAGGVGALAALAAAAGWLRRRRRTRSSSGRASRPS